MNCECGNKITEFYADGSQPTQCEWCEYPDPPMYKINHYGDSIELVFLGLAGDRKRIRRGNVTAVAPSRESAKAILDDYLNEN